MTFYEFIRMCLQQEAVRTEPCGKDAVARVLEEIERWKATN